MPVPNQIIYVEFQAADLTRTKAFFTEVFGWQFTDYGPDYVACGDNEFSVGFARGHRQSRLADGGALAVVYTHELERMRDSVKANGGTITKEIFSFPGGRRFHFVEPSGNELSVCSLDA